MREIRGKHKTKAKEQVPDIPGLFWARYVEGAKGSV